MDQERAQAGIYVLPWNPAAHAKGGSMDKDLGDAISELHMQWKTAVGVVRRLPLDPAQYPGADYAHWFMEAADPADAAIRAICAHAGIRAGNCRLPNDLYHYSARRGRLLRYFSDIRTSADDTKDKRSEILELLEVIDAILSELMREYGVYMHPNAGKYEGLPGWSMP